MTTRHSSSVPPPSALDMPEQNLRRYVRERRLWVWLAPQEGGAHARMALSSNRKLLDVDREFHKLRDRLLGDRT